MTVYLVDETEYVAADSAVEAIAFFQSSPNCDRDNEEPFEAEIADHHRYHSDLYAYHDTSAKCTMIEQANEMLAAGSKIPFSVGISVNCI